MLQTVLASLWALATLIGYQVACDRLDADSLRRRQVDAWAALSALMALGLILHGGSQVGRAALERPASPPVHQDAPERVASSVPAPQGAWPSAPDAASGIVADLGRDAGPAVEPGDAQPAASPEAMVGAAEPVVDGADPDPDAPAAAAAGSDQASTGPLPVPEVARPQPIAPGVPAPEDPVRLVPLTPTARAAQLPPPRLDPIVVPPVVEPISPTAQPEPTQAAPQPPVVPTPACGDPRELRVGLHIAEARAEREGDRAVVRFRARIRNESGFPIVATGVVAVAQDGRSSADQFGIERLPDVQIEALAGLDLSGAIALAKQPSPMSRSEICISFVAETCGLRGDQPLTRRCFQIGGF